MHTIFDISHSRNPETKINEEISVTDYSEILKAYEVFFRRSGYYLQVGDIEQTQGWILHLSVIRTQLVSLFQLLIPELMNRRIPFKIPRDIETANFILNGSLGYIHLGKILGIYIPDDQKIEKLAQWLIKLTNGFRGPAIPTDRHLGSIVYTRYGSFKPQIINNPNGTVGKYIYNNKGELILDSYMIPFRAPENIYWPFMNICSSAVPKTSKLLNYSYYPISTLKFDAKGDVIKALYFKKIWQIKPCLIKQGRENMISDDAGRDIQDRLKWQFELYHNLHGNIPLPKVFDFFQENGSTYLAMQFITGLSLTSYIQSIHNSNSWLDISTSNKIKLLDRLLDVFNIIQRLHEKGYVHRDITPENFIITSKNNTFLIDLELSWSIVSETPNPPFGLGTHGFMSPEQYEAQKPTYTEDIYALGALMIVFFTNLPPLKFSINSRDDLKNTILFFVQEEYIAELIKSCLEVNPNRRPSLTSLKKVVAQYRGKLKLTSKSEKIYTEREKPSSITIKNLIQVGLNGITSPQLVNLKHLWISKKRVNEIQIENTQVELSVYPGWHVGLAGPLWLISRAKTIGFNIDGCQAVLKENWQYLYNYYLNSSNAISEGLYMGSAGAALTLIEGMSSGLLQRDQEIHQLLKQSFSQLSPRSDLSMGLAGQGIALLQCIDWIDDPIVHNQLMSCVDRIISSQQTDGNWISSLNSHNKKTLNLGLDHGITGILFFLIAYLQKYDNQFVRNAIMKAINYLIRKVDKIVNLSPWSTNSKAKIMDDWDLGNGMPGIILTLIRTYEVLQDSKCKKIAQEYLQTLPAHPVNMDFSLKSGLAGRGELYLEAFRVFKDKEWENRANWIAEFFFYAIQYTSESSGYWMVGKDNTPTADLFTGNCGILYFLMRWLNIEKISHPLLGNIALDAFVKN